MLEIIYSSQFKKDFKKLKNLPLSDLKAIFDVISQLEQAQKLEQRYKDHELIGNWAAFRECHIQGFQFRLVIFKARPFRF